MSNDRVVTIRKDSWHYRIVVMAHNIPREKIEITSLFQYWFVVFPFSLFFLTFVAGICLALALAILLIGYYMLSALVDHPVDATLTALSFMGWVLLGVVGIAVLLGLVILIGNWFDKRNPKVKIE